MEANHADDGLLQPPQPDHDSEDEDVLERPPQGSSAAQANNSEHRNDHEGSTIGHDSSDEAFGDEVFGSETNNDAEQGDQRKNYLTEIHGLQDTIASRNNEIRGLRVTIAIRDGEIAELNRTIQELEARIRQPEPPRTRNTNIAWPIMLHTWARRGGDGPHDAPEAEDDEPLDYKTIYRQSCKEENMSCRLDTVHPNLHLRGSRDDEIKWLRQRLLLGAPSESLGGSPDGDDGVIDQDSDYAAAYMEAVAFVNAIIEATVRVIRLEDSDGDADLFVQPDEEPRQVVFRVIRTRPSRSATRLPYLPLEVQVQIVAHALQYPGKLVHCISRLDPYHEPIEGLQWPPQFGRTGLPRRLHVGDSTCSIIAATQPNDLLAPLLVSRTWHFFGVHAFYGFNTFAFSSMGEFGRFCRGIGPARLQRIQNVELLWIGNQFVSLKAVVEKPRPGAGPITRRRGATPKYISRRTWDVSSLCEMPRLKSLVIHLHESSPDYTRRAHEPWKYMKCMEDKTRRQPNFRKSRALRSLQGLDNILQLRGMKRVMFYDFSQYLLEPQKRHPIRDWTFFMDVENNVRIPKSQADAQAAMLRNLQHLTGNENVPDWWYGIVENWCGSDPYDAALLPNAESGTDDSQDIDGPEQAGSSTDSDDNDRDSDDSDPPGNGRAGTGGGDNTGARQGGAASRSVGQQVNAPQVCNLEIDDEIITDIDDDSFDTKDFPDADVDMGWTDADRSRVPRLDGGQTRIIDLTNDVENIDSTDDKDTGDNEKVDNESQSKDTDLSPVPEGGYSTNGPDQKDTHITCSKRSTASGTGTGTGTGSHLDTVHPLNQVGNTPADPIDVDDPQGAYRPRHTSDRRTELSRRSQDMFVSPDPMSNLPVGRPRFKSDSLAPSDTASRVEDEVYRRGGEIVGRKPAGVRKVHQLEGQRGAMPPPGGRGPHRYQPGQTQASYSLKRPMNQGSPEDENPFKRIKKGHKKTDDNDQ